MADPVQSGPHVVQPMTPEATVFYDFVPHYFAIVLGPTPWGHPHRVRVEVDYILVPSLDEAVAGIWEQIESLCVANELPWDPDDWDIVHLTPHNTN